MWLFSWFKNTEFEKNLPIWANFLLSRKHVIFEV